MTQKLLEIFKVGTHTTMRGEILTFTDDDMQASVEAYDPAVFAAPLVVGHPQLNDPAYGWVSALNKDGELVKAVPERVEAQFAAMVNDGRFPKISASFFSPGSASNPKPGVWYLRHVGFLGAAAPSVKGLKQAEFADDNDAVTIEFASPWLEGGWSLTRILRNLREHFIARDGIETADNIIPDYMITDIADAAQITETGTHSYAEPDEPNEEITMPDDTAANFAERETELQQKENQISEREQKLKALEQKARNDDIASFADGLINEGKLLPRHRDGLVAFMANLTDDDSVSFAEGDNTVTKSSDTWLRDFLSTLPVQVEFAEHSAANVDEQHTVSFSAPPGYTVNQAGLELHNKALAYQHQHKCDYATAVSAVS